MWINNGRGFRYSEVSLWLILKKTLTRTFSRTHNVRIRWCRLIILFHFREVLHKIRVSLRQRKSCMLSLMFNCQSFKVFPYLFSRQFYSTGSKVTKFYSHVLKQLSVQLQRHNNCNNHLHLHRLIPVNIASGSE